MFRFFTGFGIGFFAGYVLGFVIPLKVFMIACLVLVVSAIVVFLLLHVGFQDFQEY